jgi:hypothetical protein
MTVEIGTEAPIFLFWEYLLQIFGIFSLQCGGIDSLESIPENRFLRSISGLLKNLKILAQKSRALGTHALVSNVVIPLLFTTCLLASS